MCCTLWNGDYLYLYILSHTHLLDFLHGIFLHLHSFLVVSTLPSHAPFLERLRSADRKRSVRWRRPSTSMSWPGWGTTSRSSDQCTEMIGAYTHKSDQDEKVVFPSASCALSDLVRHDMALFLSHTREPSCIRITMCSIIDFLKCL